MAKMKLNGTEYRIPELDFDAMCELEERGVNLLDMSGVEEKGKMLTTIRGLVAWIMDVDVHTAGHEIGEHVKNGGGLEDIIYGINAAIEESGFMAGKKQPKRPQDHKVAQYPKKRTNRRNGNRSRR